MIIKGLAISHLVVMCISYGVDNDVKMFALDTIQHLCPYNEFCQVPAEKELMWPLTGPCCIPCSCDDRWELGNCCFDKEIKDKSKFNYNKSSLATCKSPLIKWNRGEKIHYKKYLVKISVQTNTETQTL